MKTPSSNTSLRRRTTAVFALFLAFASCATATAAELKIGIIDLSKVFKSYYKTKLADASIQDDVSGLDKELKAFSEEHDKAVSDYKKALEEANNQAVSQDEREKRKKEAEGK